MTVQQIIDEIAALQPDEQVKVVDFVCRLNAGRRLSGVELSALAERLAASTDPTRATLLREEIVRGFYGEGHHAEG